MNRKQVVLLILIIILFVSVSGCRTIYVGGSGKVGDVYGRGEIDIPVPEKD